MALLLLPLLSGAVGSDLVCPRPALSRQRKCTLIYPGPRAAPQLTFQQCKRLPSAHAVFQTQQEPEQVSTHALVLSTPGPQSQFCHCDQLLTQIRSSFPLRDVEPITRPNADLAVDSILGKGEGESL